MKYATDRPFADPDKAARKLIEIANSAEAYMDGRIPIEVINGPFLSSGGSPSEYGAGLCVAGRSRCLLAGITPLGDGTKVSASKATR